MISNSLSLKLCAILVVGIFVSGIFNILDNFIVLTLICLLFLFIVVNMFSVLSENKQNNKEKKDDYVADA